MTKDEWAIVFAGGGGNGAFEIGAWKAIAECGRYNITAVSGSSVGALNAALFAGGNYTAAEKIWKNISCMDIIPPETRTKPRRHMSIFSSNGLKSLIANEKLIDDLKQSKMPCFAACTRAPETERERRESFSEGNYVEYFDLRKESKGRIIKILLAGAAIPFVFPERKISGRYYKDGDLGGKGDCMPIKPLFDLGYRKFIVIHLDRYKPMRLPEDAACAEYIHIYPPKQFDEPIGILDFRHNSNKRRMKTGYICAKEALEHLGNTKPMDEMLNSKTAFDGLKKALHYPNFRLKVIDGEKFWHVLAENSRHKLERHIFTRHARLLEKSSRGTYRIAWGSKNSFSRIFDAVFGIKYT